ncbi:MAG: hypothetical protein JXL84_19355 [Deltaproteobacteria bacterium]|nr:hypothetical protein [Deltaproteobacteria bacterium]
MPFKRARSHSLRDAATTGLRTAFAVLCMGAALWLVGIASAPQQAGAAGIHVIVLKDGTTIKCQDAWIEGNKLYYKKYGGKMAIPVEKVDIDKTVEASQKYLKAQGEAGEDDSKGVMGVVKRASASRSGLEVTEFTYSYQPKDDQYATLSWSFRVKNKSYKSCRAAVTCEFLDEKRKVLHTEECQTRSLAKDETEFIRDFKVISLILAKGIAEARIGEIDKTNIDIQQRTKPASSKALLK